MTVIDLNARRPKKVAFHYQDGDICRALRLALEHDVISADIEEAFFELLFKGGEEDTDAARDLLFRLMESAQ
ncbi:hypothetical protein [Vreelandella massiliensis]|uniref:hypothetical protein n=1 Tax=Vreelandella massiliensis TaxID=1816686 RepID=UPI00096A36CF|nr:hypothetical protein [Halomonas massiliensis]